MVQEIHGLLHEILGASAGVFPSEAPGNALLLDSPMPETSIAADADAPAESQQQRQYS